MIAEIFKDDVAGKDFRVAILDLVNMILETFYIPDELMKADIISIWKKKGSRLDLSNDRGIFILSIFRKILDKLLYMKLYPHIEKGMSDCNIGSRKGKNVRNHLFIVYGVINSVLKERKHCVDVQIYDLVQAFDSLWLKDCMNELYEILPQKMRDRRLALVYETNVKNLVAINTPVGQTDRVNIPEIVQQGGGWGPTECSVSIDKIGRDYSVQRDSLYSYKNKVKILPLAMVDDILAITSCGLESIMMNTYINTQIEMKKLRFHTPDDNMKTKCHKIHIGKTNSYCHILKVHGEEMPAVSNDTYLGDIISSDGKNRLTIENRVRRGHGKVAEILGIIDRLSLGKHYFKIAVLLRETILLGSILTNSEVWYRLSTADLSELESLDRNFLKRLCSLPKSAPTAAVYLELGCMRISTIIKARRLNYLHYLLNLDSDEMLSRFFWTQWLDNKKHDWCYLVKADLSDFDLTNDLSEIQRRSVFSWKTLVKRKAKEYELKQLLILSDGKSKTKYLEYQSLAMQSYLIGLNSNAAKIVLKYRLRMANYSENFKEAELVKMCPLCQSHEDSQCLAFSCPSIREKIKVDVPYEYLFASEIPVNLVKILESIENIRKNCN